MAIPSRQIGGSTRTSLLWQISKQLEELICIRSGGCGSTTTTTTTIIEPTTTTTTSYPIPIECIVYNAANGNIYIYDPLTNLSVEILNDESPYFQVANTDTKLWSSQSGGYVQEYDLTFTPGPSLVFNRSINTGSVTVSGTFAIDNTTLIVGDAFTLGIYELDITTATSINTLKGAIEIGFVPNDMLLTTSGKLIIVATNAPTNTITKVYQYDYATWTLETNLNLTSQLPALNYGIGIAEYDGDIYIFTRIVECNINTTPSGVYILDPLTNNITLVNSTGLSCPSGTSSWLPCNTTSLTSSSSTTTTTTTLSAECAIAFANNNNSLFVTDGSPTTFIEFDSSASIPQSPSIATTINKLFVLVNEDNLLQPVRKIYEYNMSYSPNSLTFVREIDYPVGVNSLGNGACALSDTMLVVPIPQCTPDYAVCVNPTPIVKLNISGSVAVIDSTITYLPMFNETTTGGVPTGNVYSNLITGDIIYTTNNKIITLDQNSTWPLVSYIHQYDAITGNLEFERVLDTPLSPTLPRLDGAVGIFVFNSNLHLINNTDPITGAGTQSYIYQVGLTSPYNITSLGQASPLLLYADGSNSAGCVNVSFTPNIITTTTTTTTIPPTTTTTTTLAPSGFNTIYTYFESL